MKNVGILAINPTMLLLLVFFKIHPLFKLLVKAGFLSHQNSNLFSQKISPLFSFSKLDKNLIISL